MNAQDRNFCVLVNVFDQMNKLFWRLNLYFIAHKWFCRIITMCPRRSEQL